jgi:hypothetical protein
MRKGGSAQAGQALRGSGDFHAWTDSALYLRTLRDRLVLSVEHRGAPAPDPIELRLASRSDGSQTHLEIMPERTGPDQTPPDAPIAERLFDLMTSTSRPLTRVDLRQRLRVNNQRLGHALADLDAAGLITRSQQGWIVVSEGTGP